MLQGRTLPVRLRDLRDPPSRVFVRGELPRGPAVAVVGTRHPTEEAVAFAQGLAADLAQAGVAVFSGGAEGIDRAAHEGALRAGGVTVVVAPSGFLRPFPPSHAPLFHRVVDAGGAHVSSFADDEPAGLGSFFPRNAQLAALVHALVVVQCGPRSGARNAARRARELGRLVFAVPHCPWVPAGAGCNRELERGARPLSGARDVLLALEQLNLRGVASPPAPPDGSGPGREEALISEGWPPRAPGGSESRG